jgi:hypothetical protein
LLSIPHIYQLQVLFHSFLFFIYVYSLGNFNPFAVDNQSQIIDDISSHQLHPVVNLPSLDSIHDHVHQTDETIPPSMNTQLEKAGPLLDLIDAHPHTHDDDDSLSAIDTAKRLIIQPSIDFLDAQLHGGEEHIHANNQTDQEAADLNDFQRWLKEQNQTDQLNRFLLLQKEMNHFRLDDSRHLNDKLNRTIEELISAKQRSKHEL